MLCNTCGRREAKYLVGKRGYCDECLQKDSFKNTAMLVMPNVDDMFLNMITLQCDNCRNNIDKNSSNYHIGRRFVYCDKCVKKI